MTRIFLIIVFVFCVFNGFTQEQFLGFDNGVYLGYGQAINTSNVAHASNFTLHTENGLLIGLGVSDGVLLSIGRMVEPPAAIKFPFKPFFGVGFMRYNKISMVVANFGFHKCFFAQSQFPFSIDGGVDPIYAWYKRSNYYGSEPTIITEVTVGYSLGYTQAFFAQKAVSPVIGIAWSYAFEGEDFPFVHIGVNFRL